MFTIILLQQRKNPEIAGDTVYPEVTRTIMMSMSLQKIRILFG